MKTSNFELVDQSMGDNLRLVICVESQGASCGACVNPRETESELK